MVDASPPTQENRTPTFELEQGDLYRQYLLSNRMEILYVLRALQKHGCMATVHFDQGASFFLTWVLQVSDESNALILDVGGDGEINEKALQSTRLIVTAYVDHVKTQFRISRLEQVNFEGRPAFRAPIPTELLRLQRREFFRVATSLAYPVYCTIPLQEMSGNGQPALRLPLLDISGGGVSLKCPLEEAQHLQIGALFQNCRIELPEEGPIPVTLNVRSTFNHATTGGHHFLRVGCEFISLPGPRLTTIQRYITRIERERKAKETDFA